jgi:cytoskeleton protein RodZ
MSSDNNLSLGEFLRQERERRGVTIEQVASATKINVRLLHSLEADHYADLPAKPFVRGFVTSYARFVGLNPREILTRFGDFIDKKAHDRPNREAGHSGYAFEKRDGEQSRTMLWVFLASFIVLGGIVVILFKPPRQHRSSHADKLRTANASPTPEESVKISPLPSPGVTPSGIPSAAVAAATEPSPTPSGKPSPTPSPKPSPSAAAVAPSPSPSPKPSPTPSPKPSPAPSASPSPQKATAADPLNSGLDLKKDEIKHKVVFKALQDNWVRYQVDGRAMMRFVIRADKVLVLRARESIRFQASHPDAIHFSYNGSPMTPVDKGANVVERAGDMTLVVPPEVANSITDPFPGESPIKGRFVPAPRVTPTPAAPSP